MAKVKPITETDTSQISGYYFDCPGCENGHVVPIHPFVNKDGASWKFSGDVDKPTFSPSILEKIVFNPAANKPNIVCHSFVTDGKIRFLSDCTHPLAGQNVELPDI
jgi:hypothetical protein